MSNERIQAIANQISVWLGNTRFIEEEIGGPGDVDLVIEEILSNPDKYIDTTLSASANYQIIKEEFNLRTTADLEAQLAAMESAERDQIVREIRDQVREYGIDDVVDAVDGSPGTPPELQQRVDDVLDHVPPDVYRAEIEQQVHDLFRALGEPVTIVPESEREQREQRASDVAERRVREDVLDTLRRELGLAFGDVDEAAEEIRRRLREGQTADIRTGEIHVEVRPGDVSVVVPDEFDEWRGAALRQINRELRIERAQELVDPDARDAFSDRARVRVGTIVTRDGALAEIDLAEGRDRFGVRDDYGPDDVVDELQPDDTDPDPAEELLESMIASLEEGV